MLDPYQDLAWANDVVDSNSGMYKRLNRNERSRATASQSTGRPKKKAELEKNKLLILNLS